MCTIPDILPPDWDCQNFNIKKILKHGAPFCRLNWFCWSLTLCQTFTAAKYKSLFPPLVSIKECLLLIRRGLRVGAEEMYSHFLLHLIYSRCSWFILGDTSEPLEWEQHQPQETRNQVWTHHTQGWGKSHDSEHLPRRSKMLILWS